MNYHRMLMLVIKATLIKEMVDLWSIRLMQTWIIKELQIDFPLIEGIRNFHLHSKLQIKYVNYFNINVIFNIR